MIEYLEDKIKEELSDANGYMDKALELYPNAMCEIFYKLASSETTHANTLFHMFLGLKPSKEEKDKYCSAMKSVSECHSTEMRAFEYKKSMFHIR